MTEENLKKIAFSFLAFRVFTDFIIAGIIYYQSETLIISFSFLILCSVFHLLLFFGLKNEQFHGRNGSRVILWREPAAYWFVAAFLFVFHLIITGLFANQINW